MYLENEWLLFKMDRQCDAVMRTTINSIFFLDSVFKFMIYTIFALVKFWKEAKFIERKDSSESQEFPLKLLRFKGTKQQRGIERIRRTCANYINMHQNQNIYMYR